MLLIITIEDENLCGKLSQYNKIEQNMTKKNSQSDSSAGVRLDRWLWAARFFKTRAMAKQAIEGGKIHISGHRSKASKVLHGGEELAVRRGVELFTVDVLLLAEKRGPAKIAQTLYQETEESQKLREKASKLRHIQYLAETPPSRKPDKRQRRQIHQFKQTRDD